MSLKPYPKYKDSGIAWLGEVPEGWDLKRIKQNTYLKGRVGWKGLTSDEFLEDGYAYLVTGVDFSNKFINWHECYCVEKERYEDDPFIQLRNGDLLITKDGTIGKLALVNGLDKPACLNSGIFLVRPTSDYTTSFLYWVLRSDSFRIFVDLSSMGSTIQHLYQNVFEEFSFPIPSIKEQINISEFLDNEVGKIDELIAEQERLIALLAEKRQATISHAVTKGLNPAAPMKDSGIEWLVEVPEGWSISRFSRIIDRIKDGTHGTYDRVSEGIPLLSAKNVQYGFVDVSDSESLISESDYLEITSNGFPSRGDILLTIVGTIGRVCVFENDEPYAFQRSVCFIRLSNKQSSKYFYYFLQSKFFQVQLNGRSKSSAQAGVYMGDVAACDILYPSQYEAQLEIVKFLDAELAKLDILNAEANRVIDLLKERRTALISAAVTGKIDVREMAKVIPFPIDIRRVRGLVAIEIIENLSLQSTFGRVMLQKAAYLAETYADISELEGHYLREAAGPLDRNMIDEMESEAGNLAGINISQIGGVGTAVKYRTTGQIGKYKNELKEVLGQDRAAKLRRIINVFTKLDTAAAEAYATIFAVWNDFLIDGLTPSDDEIINGILNDWHPKKGIKFNFKDLKAHLGKMRESGLIPSGLGSKTETGRFFP